MVKHTDKTLKTCMAHVGGEPQDDADYRQTCDKCGQSYALHEKYNDGCTKAVHIFDEEMDQRILKRNITFSQKSTTGKASDIPTVAPTN
jgi:hypothetical protein